MTYQDDFERPIPDFPTAEDDPYTSNFDYDYGRDTWSDDEEYVEYDEDDEDDHDFYQAIDAEGDYLVFDPDNYIYGVKPRFEQYLKWTPYSRAARSLMLLIARIDLALLRLRNRRRAGLLKARASIDDLPF